MLNAQLVQHAYITWGDVQISYRLQGKNRKREKIVVATVKKDLKEVYRLQ